MITKGPTMCDWHPPTPSLGGRSRSCRCEEYGTVGLIPHCGIKRDPVYGLTSLLDSQDHFMPSFCHNYHQLWLHHPTHIEPLNLGVVVCPTAGEIEVAGNTS